MSAPTPVQIILVPVAGSPKEARRAKPPPYPKARRDPLPRFIPPPGQIEEIKRRGRELLEAVRAQRR